MNLLKRAADIIIGAILWVALFYVGLHVAGGLDLDLRACAGIGLTAGVALSIIARAQAPTVVSTYRPEFPEAGEGT